MTGMSNRVLDWRMKQNNIKQMVTTAQKNEVFH